MTHRHSQTEDNKQLVGVIAMAVLVGATLASIFTPRSGRENRQAVRDKIQKLKSDTQNYKKDIDEASDDAKNVVIQAGAAVKDEAEKEIDQYTK